MTGHPPDEPDQRDPKNSSSENVGADVSADEFAAALKLIVKRLEEHEPEAGAEASGRDSDADADLAAVPPPAVRESAPQPAVDEPAWREPSEPASSAGGGPADNTDLWPAAPAGGDDPLFASKPSASATGDDPLFSARPAGPADAGDPLFTTERSGPATGGDPLFPEAPAEPAAPDEPLFASKPERPDSRTVAVEATTDATASQSDPLAGLRNRDPAPTIGPAMPLSEPAGPGSAGNRGPSPPQADEGGTPGREVTGNGSRSASSEGAPTSPADMSNLDYPHPTGETSGGPTGNGASGPDAVPNDPFASASRPAFEDDGASALFGDAPAMGNQSGPEESPGRVGTGERAAAAPGLSIEADDSRPPIGELSARPSTTAKGTGPGDDAESGVELDQILPPLDPQIGTLDQVAAPSRPGRQVRVGLIAFSVLVLATLGGIGYWAYRDRHDLAALGEWALARYGPPSGQLAATLDSEPAPPTAIEAPDDRSAADEQTAALPAAPETPAPAEPASPPNQAPVPAASAPTPAPAAPPSDAADAPPAAAETTPAPAIEEAVAAAPPGRLPAHLAPLPADAPAAVRAVADRALAGEPAAQHDLANQYAIGETVPLDYSHAAYWYRLAAEAGIVNAQYNLGVLTARGLGLSQDQQRAFELFLNAAEAGHPDAQNAVGLAYMYGNGVEQDRLRAASWFQAASAGGQPRGAYHLGRLFELGLDDAPDLAAAAGWYRLAADAGDSQAREALERLTASAIRTEPPPAPPNVSAPARTPPPVPPSPAPIPAAPSELVREIQQLLNQLGYDAGREDGMMGEQTRIAIMAFQRSQGLNVSGEASLGLLALLKVVSGT